MAGSKTTTTAPGMQQAASRMGDTKGRLVANTTTIRSELESLAIVWTGEASVAFQQAMVPWLDNCDKIAKQLERMQELMSAHGVRIAATEETARQASRQMAYGAAPEETARQAAGEVAYRTLAIPRMPL